MPENAAANPNGLSGFRRRFVVFRSSHVAPRAVPRAPRQENNVPQSAHAASAPANAVLDQTVAPGHNTSPSEGRKEGPGYLLRRGSRTDVAARFCGRWVKLRRCGPLARIRTFVNVHDRRDASKYSTPNDSSST